MPAHKVANRSTVHVGLHMGRGLRWMRRPLVHGSLWCAGEACVAVLALVRCGGDVVVLLGIAGHAPAIVRSSLVCQEEHAAFRARDGQMPPAVLDEQVAMDVPVRRKASVTPFHDARMRRFATLDSSALDLQTDSIGIAHVGPVVLQRRVFPEPRMLDGAPPMVVGQMDAHVQDLGPRLLAPRNDALALPIDDVELMLHAVVIDNQSASAHAKFVQARVVIAFIPVVLVVVVLSMPVLSRKRKVCTVAIEASQQTRLRLVHDFAYAAGRVLHSATRRLRGRRASGVVANGARVSPFCLAIEQRAAQRALDRKRNRCARAMHGVDVRKHAINALERRPEWNVRTPPTVHKGLSRQHPTSARQSRCNAACIRAVAAFAAITVAALITTIITVRIVGVNSAR
jgi:hypothetical protein